MSCNLIKFSPFTFTEFYLLDAVELKVRDVGVEANFRHSMVFLKTMLTNVKSSFEEDFGRALHDYVWVASVGEARHASHKLSVSIPEISGGGRSEAYWEAEKFPPSPENREIVRSIFEDYDWGGGYGGDAWGSIVRALDLYYREETPVGIFIDHCADLQHNNGMAFNKNPDFWNYGPGHNEFMSFMNFKRDTDDLLKKIDQVYTQSFLEKHMVAPVKRVVNLAWSCFGCKPYSYEYLNGKVRRYDTGVLISYGNSRLSDIVSNFRCSYCNDPITGDYEEYSSQIACEDCLTYCDHCDCYEHPTKVTYLNGIGQDICRSCKTSYTSICQDCGEYEWDIDMVDTDLGLVCRGCAQSYEECEECEELHSPDNLMHVHDTEGVRFTVCEDCGENKTCPDCGTFFEDDSELFKKLTLRLNNGWAKLVTDINPICPICVKKHLNAFQPILKLEDTLIIGEQQTELFGLGIKGTPEGQAIPIGYWDLQGGKQVGQTEMYHAQKFNKLIVSH